MSDLIDFDEDRLLKLTIDSKPDEELLFFRSLEGTETLSGLYTFRLKLFSIKEKPVSPESIIGKAVTISLELFSGEDRFFTASSAVSAPQDRTTTTASIVQKWFRGCGC